MVRLFLASAALELEMHARYDILPSGAFTVNIDAMHSRFSPHGSNVS